MSDRIVDEPEVEEVSLDGDVPEESVNEAGHEEAEAASCATEPEEEPLVGTVEDVETFETVWTGEESDSAGGAKLG